MSLPVHAFVASPLIPTRCGSCGWPEKTCTHGYGGTYVSGEHRCPETYDGRPCGHFDYVATCADCNEALLPFLQERRAEENRAAMRREGLR